MLRRHEAGILRWSQSRVSNGVLEGINSLTEEPWPGNVRQLDNVVERSAAEAGRDADVVDEVHLIAALPNAARRDPGGAMPVPPLERRAFATAGRDSRGAWIYRREPERGGTPVGDQRGETLIG